MVFARKWSTYHEVLFWMLYYSTGLVVFTLDESELGRRWKKILLCAIGGFMWKQMRFVIAFFEKSLATLFTFVLEIVTNVFFVNLFNVIRQISLWNKSLFTLPARKSNFENAITFMLILLIFGLEGQAAVFIGALIRAVWCMFCKKMQISRLKSL